MKKIKNKWKPLHLFLYHKDDDITRANYKQLCIFEAEENVQPISAHYSYLPKTFRVDEGEWPIPNIHEHSLCDTLIYKYILLNKQRVLKSSAVCIIESDTWWQIKSKEWMRNSLLNNDIAGAKLYVFDPNNHKFELMPPDNTTNWHYFEGNLHMPFALQMRSFVPLSVVCIKPKIAVAIAEFIKDNPIFHAFYNCELRIATVANILGAKLGELPLNIRKNIYWHGVGYTGEPGIYHSIKVLLENVELPKKDKKKK